MHFYLDCGHLITVLKEDLSDASPPVIEGWACEQEEQKRWVN